MKGKKAQVEFTEKLCVVLGQIYAERSRQDEKFGDQSATADLARDYSPSFAAKALGIPTADIARERCDHAKGFGVNNLGSILVEEVAEAIEQAALKDAVRLREELVQVAAVAVLWIEAIDKRQGSNRG